MYSSASFTPNGSAIGLHLRQEGKAFCSLTICSPASVNVCPVVVTRLSSCHRLCVCVFVCLRETQMMMMTMMMMMMTTTTTMTVIMIVFLSISFRAHECYCGVRSWQQNVLLVKI